MQKIIENLSEADKKIQIANHLIYVTFPLIKNKRLLIKIIQDLKTAVLNCVNSILQYESLKKRIKLTRDPLENFKIFSEQCAPEYDLTNQETNQILDLFEIARKQEQSSMEIMKNERVILLSKNLTSEFITIETAKKYLQLSINLLKKTKGKFSQDKPSQK